MRKREKREERGRGRERVRGGEGGEGRREREREPHTSQSLLVQGNSIHSKKTQCLIDVVPSDGGCGRIVVDIMQLHMSCIQ